MRIPAHPQPQDSHIVKHRRSPLDAQYSASFCHIPSVPFSIDFPHQTRTTQSVLHPTPILFILLALSIIFVVRGAPAPTKFPTNAVDQSLHHHLIRRAVESKKIIKISAGQFQIDFHCESPKPGFCDKAAESAKLACNRIQESIKLREPVTMLFTLFKPCNQDNPTPESCSLSSVVGLAAPLHSFPVRHKDENQVYMYPTVLLKQTDLVPQGLQVAWPKYDVLSAFNELQRYTFEDANGGPDFNDMEYVSTHEISHGLALGGVSSVSTLPAGNTSLLAPGHDSYPEGSPPGEISLPIDFANQPGNLRMYRLSRPNIFERFVTYTPPNGTRTPVTSFSQQMQQAVDRIIQTGKVKPLTEEASRNASKILDLTDAVRAHVAKAGPAYAPEDVHRALVADPEVSAKMAQMMALATTAGTFDFDPARWAAIASQLQGLNMSSNGFKLESSLKPFAPGSSLGHVQFPRSLIELSENNKRRREEERRSGNSTQVPTPTASAGLPAGPTGTPSSLAPSVNSVGESDSVDESQYYLPQGFAFLLNSENGSNSTAPGGNGTNPLPPIPADLGPDFLMHASVLPWPFMDMIKQTKAPASGIGPGLLAAFVAMGYTPASLAGFVSRKDVAELVVEEIPLAK